MASPKTIIFNSSDEAADFAVKIIKKEVSKKPSLAFGLPTGSTMIPLYKKLIKAKVNLKNSKAFNIDEYLSLKNSDKNSFAYFLNKNLFSKSNFTKKNIYLINGAAKNPTQEAILHEKKIQNQGYFDLVILGIGVNSHIAFNEPGSSVSSKTRVVTLSKETINANSNAFKSSIVPKKAITVGVSTILKSKKIILLAFGDKKKQAIENSLFGKISSKNPASFLRKHKDVTFILDRTAFPEK